MPNESISKSFDFKLIDDFAGYNSARDATNVAENVFVKGSQNVYKKLSGNIAVRPGQKRRGAIDTANSPISSEFVWNTSWGATYPLIIADSKLMVEVDGTIYTLLSSLTKTRYVFDKWWDNTEKKDRVLFVNGTADMFHWSGGVAFVSTAGTNSITKTSPSITWSQAGFATNTAGEKKIMIDGTEYTYTGGETTATLTGVTPNPSAIVLDTIAIQSVITATNTPASGFNSDFLKVINNQAYVGSYTSRLCYISKDDNFADYTQATPRIPGDGETLPLDSTLKGIGVRSGNAWIGYGTGEWAEIKFNDVTVGTTLTQQTIVDVKPVSKLGAPYAHEFIGNSGNNIIYLAQDQQVRILGDFNNLFTDGYPSLSQEINTELSEENFENGAIKCIGDFIYLTAPTSGKTYLYQVRQSVNERGNVVAERLWHSPFIWNLTRVDEIDGVVYGFSNANPQIYQLWDTDQWYDDCPANEHLPYTCILALSYRNGGKRQGLITFDKNFTEGYITKGTELKLQMNYNYQGATLQTESIVNNIEYPAYTFESTLSSLGDSTLGEKILGDEIIDNTSNLVKFKTINSLTLKNCFEYQPIYFSDTADAQWEILATGTNMVLSEREQANYLINKK